MSEYENLLNEVENLRQNLENTKAKISDTNLATITKNLPSIPRIQPKSRRVLSGHLAKIYAFQWASDSRKLVSASQDGKLIVWDCFTGFKLHAIPLKSSWVMACCYSPTGRYVASGGLDNTCSIVDLKLSVRDFQQSRVVCELRGHTGFLSSCQFISDQKIITASEDTTCGLWDIEKGSLITRYQDHTSDVISIDTNQSGNMFVSGACDQCVNLWDIRISKPVQKFLGHVDDVNSVKFHPGVGNNYILSGSDDSSVRLFDVRADQQIGLYFHDQINYPITGLDVSRSGRLIFAAYDNYTVNIYDCLKQERIGLFVGHDKKVSCFGISKDGKVICTGSWDTTLRLWN